MQWSSAMRGPPSFYSELRVGDGGSSCLVVVLGGAHIAKAKLRLFLVAVRLYAQVRRQHMLKHVAELGLLDGLIVVMLDSLPSRVGRARPSGARPSRSWSAVVTGW
ncbi:hypothetical protein Dimus_022337 [Dionaea muscipula]